MPYNLSMKFAIYGVLFLIFIIVIYQLNNLFDVNDQLINKYAPSNVRAKHNLKEAQKEIYEDSKLLGASANEANSKVQDQLNKLEDQNKIDEMKKFTKRYFGQVGRNYRIHYLSEDDNMIYLHRMWFDQINKPFEVIKKDFPSIFEKRGCCFAAEPDFFIVIPGTNIHKETGDYKFDR